MAVRPVLLAVSGVKNSGKTTLIEHLLPLLSVKGIRTAVIKHDGHGFTPDTPETDSFRFFVAGACGTAVFDGEKFAVSRRAQVTEKELLAFFPDADLILLEGFKNSEYKKLELVRAGVSASPVCDERTCIAIITDLDLKTNLPLFHPDSIEGIAELIALYIKGANDD